MLVCLPVSVHLFTPKGHPVPAQNKERIHSVPGVKSKSDYRKMIEEALGAVVAV